MAETILPGDLIAHIKELRQYEQAHPAQSVKPEISIDEMKRRIGRFCQWAANISSVAVDRRIPTNIDIIDKAVNPDHPERIHVLHSGWKITVDPSIGGGGDLSYSYHYTPPMMTSRGVLLTADQGLLYAFKSAKNLEGDDGTVAVVDYQPGMVSNFGDGFGAYSLAPIRPTTYPLPVFLDTWDDPTGISVLENNLILFARRNELDQ